MYNYNVNETWTRIEQEITGNIDVQSSMEANISHHHQIRVVASVRLIFNNNLYNLVHIEKDSV